MVGFRLRLRYFILGFFLCLIAHGIDQKKSIKYPVILCSCYLVITALGEAEIWATKKEEKQKGLYGETTEQGRIPGSSLYQGPQ